MEGHGIAEDYFNDFTDKSLCGKELVKECVTDADLPSMINGCFDCNICLDFATDPVVTLCGHLYCWPCIHKWLQIKCTSPCRCPVCKAFLSKDALVPLYGRGLTKKGSNHNLDYDVPQRPQLMPYRTDEQVTINQQPSMQEGSPHNHFHYHNYLDYYGGNLNDSHLPPSWPMETRVFRSTAGGVLEGIAHAVLPWMFRNHGRMYHPRPHLVVRGAYTTRQQRRQEMLTQRLISQIWSFLFCCAILCLLLF
ncbi:hypothetical protein J5N97_028944 [Dioscorea zingiberensis]|uniref:E3 ubiquitin-protein ligase RMA n=1 Tax=Dioscorea zingiberensis TaxID=325984 RepID=A0A9D5C0I6_9LILI|nr:hypothetical protein J5N97_028944 [Dioscorea zingiberensis]